MKRFKNFFKKNLKVIIICIALMIITSMVSVYAAYNYLSTDVSYTKADGTTVSVADALNELYNQSSKIILLTKDTAAGTKIGTTTVDGQTLDWYLFDVSDDGKTAYLVSNPTHWVPDTTKEVRGAYPPKLVSYYSDTTHAMRQAIQKLANGTDSYSSGSVKYTPTTETLNKFKEANSQWNKQRGSTPFASMNENEQCACYLYDEDIFAGIKNQVNNANGNLKGKIQTLVGGASAEQWCKAYNKQTAASSSKITCEYSTTRAPGYRYSTINDESIVGNDIYGAAHTNNHSDNSTFPFSSCFWWLASPSSEYGSDYVCLVKGSDSCLDHYYSGNYYASVSLFASVAL